jgi:hypothetical protein
MKPKLGIYGDSWVNLAVKKVLPKEYCWTYNPILLENYDIIRHPRTSGMDFYTAFDYFKKTHEECDNVVFVATNALRQGFVQDKTNYTISSYYQSEQALIDDFSSEIEKHNLIDQEKIKKILKAIRTCLLYIPKDELYEAGQAKLMEEIKKIKSTAIVIPAFENRFITETYLCQIHNMEIESMGITIDEHQKLWDLRHAHMTKENNEIFANYIYDRLQGKDIKLSLDMFVKSKPEEKSKYFAPR